MDQDQRKRPDPAKDEGRAQHGYQSEVSWDGGQGGQPYTNQEEQHGPAAAHETEAGNRGAASGRTLEQMEAMKRVPVRPEDEAPRERAADDRDGVR